MRTHLSSMYEVKTHENDLLLIIDVQRDFTYGSLENLSAIKRIPGIIQFVKGFNGKKIATKDTHYVDYLQTQEGINLPVPHTQKGTPGHDIVTPVERAMKERHENGAPVDWAIIEKNTFGSIHGDPLSLTYAITEHHYDNIYILGFCTGICVISNAVIAKAADPEARIHVLEPLCACVTKASHDTAISAMEMLQMDVIDWPEEDRGYGIIKSNKLTLVIGSDPNKALSAAKSDGIETIPIEDLPANLPDTHKKGFWVRTDSCWKRLREIARA